MESHESEAVTRDLNGKHSQRTADSEEEKTAAFDAQQKLKAVNSKQ